MDHALFPDRLAHGVVDVATGERAVDALDSEGFWAVVATFEGGLAAVRFRDVVPVASRGTLDGPTAWSGIAGEWRTSLGEAAYVRGVQEIRRRIAAGEVYQVNLCRVLETDLPEDADLDGLAVRLAAGNPAPHACRIRCDAAGLDVVSASPELFLSRRDGVLTTRPIKGTAPRAEEMLDKDHAENVMIVDLMRNDISPMCVPGTIRVPDLCAIEEHPGLVHLVSIVQGDLAPDVAWRDILAATMPPGSVSGAPKSSALTAIRDLEPTPRGPYCGAVGWVDADAGTAELAVGIRTFWAERTPGGRVLRFGTGAGITWGSDPQGEWSETELKARRLIGLASGVSAPSETVDR